jgi:cytochrome c553
MKLAQNFFGHRFCWQGCWIAISLVIGLVFLASDESFGDQSLYEREVKPVLRERCFACHGALKQESGLRLDTARMMKQGGDSGAALSAGEPDASPLIERIEGSDLSLRMPPGGEPLSEQQIAALRQWISAGAPAPIDETCGLLRLFLLSSPSTLSLLRTIDPLAGFR